MSGRTLILQDHSFVSVNIEHFDSCIALLEGGQFDVFNFIDLSSYLDLGVLYDSLMITGLSEDTKPENLSTTTQLLLKEHLFSLPPKGKRFFPIMGKTQQIIIAFAEAEPSTKITWGKYFWGALEHESSFSLSYHVPVKVLGKYLDAVQIEQSHHIYSLLFKAYAQLSGTLRGEVEKLQHYVKSNTIFIPPITTTILKKSSSPRDVVDIFLEMRHKFRPVRDAFREYESKIQDESMSLEKSIKAIDDLKRSIKLLTTIQEENLVISEWRDGLSLLPDIDSVESAQKGLLKFFLGKPLDWIINRIRNRKLILLFNLKKEFLKTSNYPQLIRKVFSYDIHDQDVQTLNQIWSQMDRLARLDKRLSDTI